MEKKDIIRKTAVLCQGEFIGESADDVQFINIDETPVERFSGCAGSFEVLYRSSGKLNKTEAGAVVIAGSFQREESPGQAAYASLGEESPDAFYGKRIGILLDRSFPADETVWQHLLNLAPVLVREGASVDILFRDVEVAFLNGQESYSEAKNSGVGFIRYSGKPVMKAKTVTLEYAVISSPSGSVTAELEYDIIAEPGSPKVSESLKQICTAAGVFLDTELLPVKGNLRYEPPATNINGVLYADHGTFEKALETARAFTAAGSFSYEKSGVEIDGSRCAACLTCVRICPLKAPYIGYDEELQLNRAFIRYEVCGGCGICAGECPGDAITVSSLEESE